MRQVVFSGYTYTPLSLFQYVLIPDEPIVYIALPAERTVGKMIMSNSKSIITFWPALATAPSWNLSGG